MLTSGQLDRHAGGHREIPVVWRQYFTGTGAESAGHHGGEWRESHHRGANRIGIGRVGIRLTDRWPGLDLQGPMGTTIGVLSGKDRTRHVQENGWWLCSGGSRPGVCAL